MSIVGIDLTKFTPTEQRIIQLLFDGQFHSVSEITQSCLQDDQATARNLSPHIVSIKRKLNDRGLLILQVTTNGRRPSGKGYQMSRRLLRE